MKKYLFILLVLISVSVSGVSFAAIQTQPIIDIAVIGSGFTPENLWIFNINADIDINYILSMEPFKSEASRFSFHKIPIASDFNCRFEKVGEEGDAYYCDENKVRKAVEASGVPYDKILLIINSARIGGLSSKINGDLVVAFNGIGSHFTALHELAHAFGLWDEYVSQSIDGPIDNKVHGNCFAGTPPAKEWEGIVKLADYRLGCTYPNWYRSSDINLMTSKITPLALNFNAVSQNILRENIRLALLPKVSLSVSGSGIATNSSYHTVANLNWVGQKALRCYASGSWDGVKPTSGSEEVKVTQTSLYSLNCVNDYGASRKYAVIWSLPQPVAPKAASITLSRDREDGILVKLDGTYRSINTDYLLYRCTKRSYDSCVSLGKVLDSTLSYLDQQANEGVDYYYAVINESLGQKSFELSLSTGLRQIKKTTSSLATQPLPIPVVAPSTPSIISTPIFQTPAMPACVNGVLQTVYLNWSGGKGPYWVGLIEGYRTSIPANTSAFWHTASGQNYSSISSDYLTWWTGSGDQLSNHFAFKPNTTYTAWVWATGGGNSNPIQFTTPHCSVSTTPPPVTPPVVPPVTPPPPTQPPVVTPPPVTPPVTPPPAPTSTAGIVDIKWVGTAEGGVCPSGYTSKARLQNPGGLSYRQCVKTGTPSTIADVLWSDPHPLTATYDQYSCPSGYSKNGVLSNGTYGYAFCQKSGTGLSSITWTDGACDTANGYAYKGSLLGSSGANLNMCTKVISGGTTSQLKLQQVAGVIQGLFHWFIGNK